MKVPDPTVEKIKRKLWEIADERSWSALSDQEKSFLYEEWIKDKEIGGVLSRYVDPRNVRVYLKDTIMKPYGRERIRDFTPIIKRLGLSEDIQVIETYIKPHGRRLSDGRVICWGLARDWKAILFAVFERAYVVKKGVPFCAVIMSPSGKLQQPIYREMVETAGEKMGIERLEWCD